jgi:RIO kinase 2
MSSADVAVKVFLQLAPEDFRVLLAIELEMSKHENVPQSSLPRVSGLTGKQVKYRLNKLDKLGLVKRSVGSYVGYALNTVGYDCLAMNALVKADVLEAFGKPLGVGKESDVYDALAPGGERVAIKFHRLGRTSFRQTRRLRGYIADRRHISWLYQSRLAAEKEYEALKIVHPMGVAVPKPVGQNRHVVVMNMIEGAELYRVPEIANPEEVLDEILLNVRKAYQRAGVVHADLSEYNVVLKPDMHVLIIDWPQYVKTSHPNADMLLTRDVQNILRFFRKRFKVRRILQQTVDYIKEAEANSDYAVEA